MHLKNASTVLLAATLTFGICAPAAASAPVSSEQNQKLAAAAVNGKSTSSILLEWPAYPMANRYEVRFSVRADFTDATIVEKVNSRTVSTLKDGTKYYFQYRALLRAPGTPAGTYDRSEWSATSSATTNALFPGAFTSVKAPGGADSLNVRWNKTANTTHYTVTVADDHAMKRNKRVFTNIKSTSFTVKKLTHGSRSGMPTFVQVQAHNKGFKTRTSSRITAYAAAPKVVGTELVSIGSQNLLCASCVPSGPKRAHWKTRVKIHMDTIKNEKLDVILLQEALNQNIPGSKTKTMDDLGKRLKSLGYALDRTPEKGGPNQMVNRVAYNSSKYQALKRGTFALPAAKGGGVRGAAWVLLKSKKTGKQFYVASVHIDPKLPQSGKVSKDSNAALINKQMTKINKKNLPVVVGGDFNSSFYAVPNTPHQQLMKSGWTDAASSASRTNYMRATTSKGTGSTMGSTYGRIDYVFTKNIAGTVSYKNVVKFKGNKIVSKHGSDHHMVVAKVKLK